MIKCANCDFENAPGAVFCASCQETIETDLDDFEELDPLPDDLEERISAALVDEVRILREIGRGGMAVVYEGLDLKLNRRVAIKCLPIENTRDRNLVLRFRREAQLAASLTHPNIIPVYSVGFEEGIHYFTMGYLDGGSLEERIDAGLSYQDSVAIIIQIAKALDYAHGKGLIHRDIKPSNVMFDETGAVRVLDFGIAHIMHEARLTITRAILGTPEYMSPEQALSKPLDGRTDLYALGTVFYQMITGELPFKADEPLSMIYKHVNDKPTSPTKILPDVPLPLSRIILKLMHKNPEKRFQTGGELVAALEDPILQDSLTPPAHRNHTAPTVFIPSFQRLNQSRTAVFVAIPVILLLLLFIFWPSSEEPTTQPTELPQPAQTLSTNLPEKDMPPPEPTTTEGEVESEGQEAVEVEPIKTHAEAPATTTPAPKKDTTPKVVKKPEPKKSAAEIAREKMMATLLPVLEKVQLLDVFPTEYKRGGYGGGKDAQPGHKVELSPFRLARTEVTQELWDTIMDRNEACVKGKTYPITQVSYEDAQAFIKKLNDLSGRAFRLPTEAEWEYVARTGRNGPYGPIAFDQMVWYERNASGPMPVRGKEPNSLGFYDIQGNVWEWCHDFYGPYSGEAQKNPKGPETGSQRVLRGGSYANRSNEARHNSRYSLPAVARDCTVGFRLAEDL